MVTDVRFSSVVIYAESDSFEKKKKKRENIWGLNWIFPEFMKNIDLKVKKFTLQIYEEMLQKEKVPEEFKS